MNRLSNLYPSLIVGLGIQVAGAKENKTAGWKMSNALKNTRRYLENSRDRYFLFRRNARDKRERSVPRIIAGKQRRGRWNIINFRYFFFFFNLFNSLLFSSLSFISEDHLTDKFYHQTRAISFFSSSSFLFLFISSFRFSR